MTAAMGVARKLRHCPPLRNHQDLGRHAGWYVVAGASTTLAQLLLFATMRPLLGSHIANLIAIALTTLANTEFHRRVTFRESAGPAWRRHLQSVLSFTFYATYGAGVLLLVDSLVAEPSALVETLALGCAACAGGIARFIVLRWWVFITR